MKKQAIVLLCAFGCLTASGEVRLASVFTDHMVLQRGKPVPVWGTAEPGEKVTVEFFGQTKTTVVNSSKHWKILLEPMSASSKPRKFKVSTTLNSEFGTMNLTDVLVGDVWLCGGQSNM